MLAGPNDADELKVPTSIDSLGSLCPGSSTNSAKWLSFDDAVAAAQTHGLGIGIAITAEDPFCCIDLDVKNTHNRPESPDLWTSAEELARIGNIIEMLDSYTEISGSGQGAHIWVRANIGQGMKRDSVEVYSQQRFIVCTGNIWNDKAIENRQEIVGNMVSQMQSASPGTRTFELVEVSESDTDEVVLDRATRAKNSEKFDALAAGDWKGRYPSQSEADLALIAILCFYSRCDSQVRRMFRATGLGKREKASKNNRYLDYCLRRVRSRQAFEEAQRAQYQIDLKRRLREVGEGTLMRSPMPSLTANEMLKQFVFILARSNVALIDRPTFMAPLSDFRNLTTASFTEIKVVNEDGSEKTTRHRSIDLWMNHPERLMAETVTFDPRHGEFCADPQGHQALNLYRPRPHVTPSDWAARVLPFLEHVAYLVPVAQERERFLDWLAHIEHQPGKLPHSGYLMIATNQGVGRNWMAGVFASVWRGHVALDFDLGHVLSSGFNGRLSQKFLAVVDEINEGVQTDQWRHNEKLKSMVTAEVRNINPKFGFERVEHNCCRWLMFSNHESAIPLKDTDRRWNVIRNPSTPRHGAYYAALYKLLEDPQFIASVREFFRQRNLSAFNPGARPILNDAKRAVIESTRSEADERALELVRSHPCDLITGDSFCQELYGDKHTDTDHGKLKHRAKAAGIEKWQGNGGGRIRLLGKRQTTVWILRNAERWAQADTDAVMQELRQPVPL